MEPETLEEWREYIEDLEDKELVFQSEAANSVDFVDTLKDEDYGSKEIEDILTMFAEELEARNKLVPGRAADMFTSYFHLLNGYDTGEV